MAASLLDMYMLPELWQLIMDVHVFPAATAGPHGLRDLVHFLLKNHEQWSRGMREGWAAVVWRDVAFRRLPPSFTHDYATPTTAAGARTLVLLWAASLQRRQLGPPKTVVHGAIVMHWHQGVPAPPPNVIGLCDDTAVAVHTWADYERIAVAPGVRWRTHDDARRYIVLMNALAALRAMWRSQRPRRVVVVACQ